VTDAKVVAKLETKVEAEEKTEEKEAKLNETASRAELEPADVSHLSVERLRVSYPGAAQATVEGLSFQLARGAIGCLLGASGCGKTTVLRALAGFIKPRKGAIHLAGRRLADETRSLAPEARNIGMVFQDFALFPHLTVAENIVFGLGRMPPAQRRERLAKMLALTNLQAEERRYPHELSGGQQQRVALARALAPQPALLLLDEPFSSLDVELRERLSLEVRSILKATGTTAILVTHDQREAFAVSDMIGVMSQGRIEQWDTAYNLYHRPATRYVADFIGEGVFLPGTQMDSVTMEHSHVQTELGFITPPDTCAHRHLGARAVDVLLRPDDVVHDDSATLKGTVIRKAFRGAEFLYTLRLPSGGEVLALVPSHHDHAIGEAIGIRLEAEHVVTFAVQPRPPLSA
jgi:iron(III) transport system ATP-binding protein